MVSWSRLPSSRYRAIAWFRNSQRLYCSRLRAIHQHPRNRRALYRSKPHAVDAPLLLWRIVFSNLPILQSLWRMPNRQQGDKVIIQNKTAIWIVWAYPNNNRLMGQYTQVATKSFLSPYYPPSDSRGLSNTALNNIAPGRLPGHLLRCSQDRISGLKGRRVPCLHL
jgi:hypothetical protein